LAEEVVDQNTALIMHPDVMVDPEAGVPVLQIRHMDLVQQVRGIMVVRVVEAIILQVEEVREGRVRPEVPRLMEE